MTAARPDPAGTLEPGAAEPPQPGALLSERQIQWLRRAVVVMTALLVGGIVLVIGRVIYLARPQAAQAPAAATVAGLPTQLLPQARLTLPEGAAIRNFSLVGSRLVVWHSLPSGIDGFTIFDLATGRVESRVEVGRGP